MICTLYCWVLSKEVSSTIFKVFGMTRPGIEPRSPEPLVNSLPTWPMSWFIGRCPWCNGYRHRKWTQRHKFKFWTRLIAFHIALIPFGKVCIQLFSLQLWVIVGQTVFFSLGKASSLGEEILWIQTCWTLLKIDLVSYPAGAEGLVNMSWFINKFLLNDI